MQIIILKDIKMYNITILWATDWFGKWTAWFILEKFRGEVNLTITWRNKYKAIKSSEELNCNYSTDNIKSVKEADIVIFSVPIWYMEDTIKEVIPHMKKWSLAVDVCSIKGFPSKTMKEYAPEGVLVLPTHPMFGPYVSSIAGQIFVLTPEKKVKIDKRYIFLKSFLEWEWAKVIEASPLEHDKMMAVVQWLTHFDMFVLWETIKRLWIDIHKSMDFVSPIYKIMISSVARYMNQNPKLYGDIQMYNTEVLEVHKVFMEATDDFNRFVRDKDEDSFVNTIKDTSEYFWENALKGQKYTDKIIYLISKQIERLEKNIWKNIKITNIYTKVEKTWTLEKFENDIIYLNGEEFRIDEWDI